MTNAVDERDAEASPKFRVLLTASLVSSLIIFGSSIVAVSLPSIGRSLEASFADVQRVIRRVRAHPHQRACDCSNARGGSRKDAT